MPSLTLGQHAPQLLAYCHDCKSNVRAYWVCKDGKPIVAICPEPGHDRVCKIQEKLQFGDLMSGIDRITVERTRQVYQWGDDHDDEHTNSELALAAVAYALPDHQKRAPGVLSDLWPFGWGLWKPSPNNRIRELEKAGALIAAEIDRLERV